jgi:hypothetical protein
LYFDIFCWYIIQTKWWSKLQSASVQLLTYIMFDACLPYTIKWSMWFEFFCQGDIADKAFCNRKL